MDICWSNMEAWRQNTSRSCALCHHGPSSQSHQARQSTMQNRKGRHHSSIGIETVREKLGVWAPKLVEATPFCSLAMTNVALHQSACSTGLFFLLLIG